MTEKLNPFDVAALERSLNDSAARVSTIWISYLIFALYLFIATGTATHSQLFLGDPLKLPVLNIDLPLYWFFILAPILFVLFHLYVLLQVLLLGRTAVAYNDTVNQAVKPPRENALVRQRLANTLFAQIFAGSPREREGWLGWLLKAMAWITLALAPIYVVLAFQFVFLPYHSHLVTWTHRLLLLVELTAAFLLWPLVLDARRDFNWYRLRRRVARTAAIPVKLLSAKDQRRQEWHRLRLQRIPVAICMLFVAISLSLASFPGEPHINLLTGNSLFAVQCHRWFSDKFDRLVLPGVDVAADEKVDKIEKATASKGQEPFKGERTRSFRGRDLNCGIFDGANLRLTDFVQAGLQGADLSEARLQGADLSNAELQDARLFFTELRGASLELAQLQRAFLLGAQLQGANLSEAKLSGASLTSARLQGAGLHSAVLQGAQLGKARLEAADLRGAYLQGAQLWGTWLLGADLSEAGLEGADLKGAHLQGADLGRAKLQGTELQDSELGLALLSNVYVWRANHASCSDARVTDPSFDRGSYSSAPVSDTPEEIARFIERVVANVREKQKNEVRTRMLAGLVDPIQKGDLAAIETNWRNCAANSEKIVESEYLRQHADLLRGLVCNATSNRKEIAEGITNRWILSDRDRRVDSSLLARGLLGLDGKECAATKDLSDRTKERLRDFLSTLISAQ
jgi:uncharacterized protein YjbI with pentapeptide repeats